MYLFIVINVITAIYCAKNVYLFKIVQRLVCTCMCVYVCVCLRA